MRWRVAALALSGLVGAAALAAALAALAGPGSSRPDLAARFRVAVAQPLVPVNGTKTFRVTLAVTNVGTAGGWPACEVVATSGGGLHHGAARYWSMSMVRPKETVRTDVRLTIVNGGTRFITYRDVAARCHAAAGPAPPPPPKPTVVVPAVAPASLPPRQVGSLQMFSARDGVAIGGIEEPDDLAGPVYLLETSDGGESWSVTGTLPVRLAQYQLTSPHLAFESTSTGYLEVYDRAVHHDVVLFTTDGGATWSRVTVPGVPTSVSLDAGALWVVAYRCPEPTLSPGDCPARLLTYDAGALAPASSHPIPVEPPASFPEATLLRRLGPTDGVFSVGGSTPGPHALLFTTDAGSSWQQVPDPCLAQSAPLVLSPTSLVALGPEHWLLLCDQPAGMENYNTALYRTTDGGSSWQLVASHNVTPTLPDVGTIGGGSLAALSGDGRTLWMTDLGGVSWSQDGGLDWTVASGVTTDGVSSGFASAGTGDAWLAVPFRDLYFTTNGTTWRMLH